MFSPFYSSLWCAEFILELAGAVLIFKNFRSIKILWSYLAFRAGADLFSFALACGWGSSHYGWANYGQRLLGYIFLAALSMRVIGVAFNVDTKTVRKYGTWTAGVAALAIGLTHAGPWQAASLYVIGFRADMVLGVFIGSAMLLREFEVIVLPMEKHWGLICSATLTAVFSHGLCSELRMHGYIGLTAQSCLMAAGQLVALSIWILAAWRRPQEFAIIRLDSIGSPKTESLALDEPLTGTVN